MASAALNTAVAGAIVHEREILEAVRAIRYGSVEVVIHDSKVVQVIRTEKVRFDNK